MAFKFPFTNYHELNLTWVLDKLKELFEASARNVEEIETYNDRLSEVETELPVAVETAQEASQTAANAASLANTAKGIAENAHDAAISASSQAGNARSIANNAKDNADTAINVAQGARNTAENAQGTAEQALTKSESALSLAENAPQALEIAKDAQTELYLKADAGNMLKDAGEFPTSFSGFNITWNANKTRARIVGTSPISSLLINIFNVYEGDTVQPPFEPNKEYNIVFKSSDSRIRLFYIDSLGSHYADSGVHPFIPGNDGPVEISLQVTTRETIDANIIISIPNSILYMECEKDNLSGTWGQLSLTSSSGLIGVTVNPRATTMIFVPHDVITFSCSSANSCVSAWNKNEYIGVLGSDWIFRKQFTNINQVDFKKLFYMYPDYEFRITVYCVPSDIEKYVTILRSKQISPIVVRSKINTMGNYLEDYFNQAQNPNSVLAYSALKGLFAEDVKNEQDQNVIQCSELVYAVLCKIPFNKSRYEIDYNIPSGQSWRTDGSVADLDYCPTPYIYEDYLQADQLAKYFHGKNQLIPFNLDHNNIKPGDIVFVAYGTNNNFLNITHCAIVVDFDKRFNTITTVDAGEVTKLDGTPAGVSYRRISSNSMYYAKIDIETEYNNTSKLSEGFIPASSLTAGQSKSLGTMVCTSLKPGFYSLIIDGDIEDPVLTFLQQRIYTNDSLTEYQQFTVYSSDYRTKNIINFAIPYTDKFTLFINAYNSTNNSVDVPVLNYRIYKGWLDADPERKD